MISSGSLIHCRVIVTPVRDETGGLPLYLLFFREHLEDTENSMPFTMSKLLFCRLTLFKEPVYPIVGNSNHYVHSEVIVRDELIALIPIVLSTFHNYNFLESSKSSITESKKFWKRKDSINASITQVIPDHSSKFSDNLSRTINRIFVL